MPKIPKETKPTGPPANWAQFKERWQNCTACPLAGCRNKIVLAKGKIPCDVLFIGEAPGPSEDVIGQPFVGPAGKLLDQMINEAAQTIHGVMEWKYAFTNLVCCIPKEEKGGSKFGEPPKEAIVACRKRLMEFINLCQPQLIVMVGKLAGKYLPSQHDLGGCEWLGGELLLFAELVHPAAILRADISTKGLLYQRNVAELEANFSNMIPF